MKDRKIPLSGVCLAILLLSLSACGSPDVGTEASYGQPDHDKLYKNGSLLSDQGGADVLNLGGDEKGKDASGIGVNGFLWRASLDTVSFMPIASADPFGGIIITDWYSSPNDANERMRLNIFIRDRELRADGVKVSVFRQSKGTDGRWMDAAVTPTTGPSLENAILTKARQIRLTQKESK